MPINNKGFIIDVPRTLVKTSSGDTQIYNSNQGSVKFEQESINIAGGWSAFDLAEIDTKRSIEISTSDTIIQMDTLKLTTGGNVVTAATAFWEFGVGYTVVTATHKITLPHVVNAASMRINGYLEVSGTPTANEFKVTIGPSNTELLFNTAADGLKLYPAYTWQTAETTETLTVTSASFAKSGECVVTFPIYKAEDVESNIIAYGQLYIYKAKIKADLEIGGQYKSASTFTTVLKGLDAGRSDLKIWDFKYRLV